MTCPSCGVSFKESGTPVTCPVCHCACDKAAVEQTRGLIMSPDAANHMHQEQLKVVGDK